MVNQETVKKWNLNNEFGFKLEDDVVTKMFSKVCKEYYNGNPQTLNYMAM